MSSTTQPLWETLGVRWPVCTTMPGWAHNPQTFQWELHDERGRVIGAISEQSVWSMVEGPRGAAQDYVVRRFMVPLPVLDVPPLC